MPDRWRTGRKLGRTIYRMVGEKPSDDDVLIGIMDDPKDAEKVVALRSQAERLEEVLEVIRIKLMAGGEANILDASAIARDTLAALSNKEGE